MIRSIILNSRFSTETVKVDHHKEIYDKMVAIGVITEASTKIDSDFLNKHIEEYLILEVKNENQEAYFQLGQIYFDQEKYENSLYYFKEGARKFQDYQCMFQSGVQYYDGLGCTVDPELGCSVMKCIIENRDVDTAQHLFFAAAYNLGRAYYEGFGVRQSDEEAERLWLLAADDGNPQASVVAQSALGFFYSTPGHFDLAKSFFWHSEACGNGSIESQASLGVMYLYGLGVPVDWKASLICLSNAAERGSVYAKGNLCYYFYKRKLFTKAADLAAKLCQIQEEDLERLSKHSSIIIMEYLRKGLAIGCFIFARCLQQGLGVQQECDRCLEYFKKAIQWDAEVASDFHKLVERGQL